VLLFESHILVIDNLQIVESIHVPISYSSIISPNILVLRDLNANFSNSNQESSRGFLSFDLSRLNKIINFAEDPNKKVDT